MSLHILCNCNCHVRPFGTFDSHITPFIRLIELELLTSCPKEQALKIAHAIQHELKKTPVRMIFKQKKENPSTAVLVIVRSSLATCYHEQLQKEGYTVGKKQYLTHKRRSCPGTWYCRFLHN